MVGGGQLARMTHQAAIALGQSLRILAAGPDDGAAKVAADVRFGLPTDLAALREFAEGCDVVTFDHEHVPGDHIRALAAAGATVLPSADALRYAQDKSAMRRRLAELGVPVPRWEPVGSVAEVAAFADRTGGWPVVLKAVRGGYDGRGVWVVKDATEAAGPVAAGGTLLVEEHLTLRRELAVQLARSPFGQVAVYPVVETVQADGVCVEVIAPAPDLPEELAVEIQELAIRIADELDVVGMLAVELFQTPAPGRAGILVNELAMRPHNSGHWTIEGARTSQFEQHLRGVLDYPLGETRMTAPVAVMGNVLAAPERPDGQTVDERLHHLFAADPGVKVHLYAKEPRPGRKIGHVTALGEDLGEARARAGRAVRRLREG